MLGACRSQLDGIEGPCWVSDTVDQKVVCWFGPVEFLVDEEGLGESAVSCVFRQSCRIVRREICPFALLKLDLPEWAGQPVCGRTGCCLCVVGAGLVWLLSPVLWGGVVPAGGGRLAVAGVWWIIGVLCWSPRLLLSVR